MVKLVHGLKAHEILLQDRFVMGGNSHFLTMTKVLLQPQEMEGDQK
jgi:hypothetical protein